MPVKIIIVLLAIILFAAVILFFILPSGRKHPQLKSFNGGLFAHRGLYNKQKGIPENSLAAFNAAVKNGFGIELDVRLCADGELFVMHDENTARMTGKSYNISETSSEILKQLTLNGTDEHIPTFAQVLETIGGAVPVIIELKAQNKNHEALGKAVFTLLRNYKGEYVAESFDPLTVRWLRINQPHIARGQLIMHFRKSGLSSPSYISDFLAHNLLFNFLTRPDFVAAHYPTRNDLAVRICRRTGAFTVVWTVKTPQELLKCKQEGANVVIFEGFMPEK